MPTSEVLLDGTHDPRQLRNALGRFSTGVTVITTRAPSGKREGLTANSFSALSLSPPLVLWSLVSKSASLPGFLAAGHFAIHVLASNQADISHRFATPSADKFAGLAVEEGLDGAPLLSDVLAVFECSTERSLEAGDHVLFIGQVRRIRYADGDPLIFNAGRYCTALPMRSPTAESDLDAVWDGLG
ncbi:flavin reductase family protein [Piscinibacter sakaiensis]|uniref:flavin reductase family protein n=1 Tax=Piscinibacter sakaiensis TaxID=1547922 RepID=UPI003AAE1F85